jgi:drug/metabolite transporter (DMT)-like permease
MIASPAPRSGTPLTKTLLAFACIYLIWGSTYLLAGSALYAWISIRREGRRPTAREWAAAFLYGSCFFVLGNGGVSWSEQRIPSGIVALLVAGVPLWIVLFEWLRPGGGRPTPLAIAGLAIGFAGIAILIGPGRSLTQSAVDPVGAIVMIFATFGWAYGTVHAKNAPHPPSLLQTAAMQMLGGGLMAIVVGSLLGEWSAARLDAVTARSALALLYLIVLGSVVAFSAYTWLLRNTTPDRVGTYAYVNPIVAVVLGWAIGGEPITPRTLVAGSIVVTGVILILNARARSIRPAPVTSR